MPNPQPGQEQRMDKVSPALAEGPTVTEEMKHAGAFIGAAYGHPKMFYPDGEMLAEIYAAMHAARPAADPGEYGELGEALANIALTMKYVPDQVWIQKARDRLETQAATIARLREALERIKQIAQRKDMGAPAKVACIESIAHSAALSPNPTSP